MSVAAMAWAWGVDVRPGLKLVLLALADHADNRGRCWPGIDGVALKTGMSTRQVKRCVSELSGNGLINISRRGGTGAGRNTSVYDLLMQSPIVTPSGLSDTMSPSGLSDTMSPSGLSDTMSPRGKVTFEGGLSDICDMCSKEEPSIEPSINKPPKPPKQKNAQVSRVAKKSAVVFELPTWVDSVLWAAYLDMRKLIRKPMTPYAKMLAVRKLQDLSQLGHDPGAVLRQSIEGSYQGLFGVRSNHEKNSGSNETASQRHQRIGAAMHKRTKSAFEG